MHNSLRIRYRFSRAILAVGSDRDLAIGRSGSMQANGERITISPSISSDGGKVSVVVSADTRGRHRILAELKRLEQESRFLEEELEELERTERVSAALQELLQKVEGKPDPLLPTTNGPTNAYWDRWFEGPQDMRGCKCWII